MDVVIPCVRLVCFIEPVGTYHWSRLMIVGSNVFPTGGNANPTLTIAALSLRASDFLIGQLRVETAVKRVQ